MTQPEYRAVLLKNVQAIFNYIKERTANLEPPVTHHYRFHDNAFCYGEVDIQLGPKPHLHFSEYLSPSAYMHTDGRLYDDTTCNRDLTSDWVKRAQCNSRSYLKRDMEHLCRDWQKVKAVIEKVIEERDNVMNFSI